MTTIGFIGSGHIGSTIAKLAIDNGYDVVMSNSRGPESLKDLVEGLGPKARAGTPEEAAEAADIAVVTIPMKAYADVPFAPLAGKIVIDTNDYYPARDGHISELDNGTFTSAGLLQNHLPSSTVVKAFNTIPSQQLASEGTPNGTPGRRALAISGDDVQAKAMVTDLINRFGFDTVDAGPLHESWRIEPGAPAYGVRMSVAELTKALAEAKPWAGQS
jgi:predicted dinucleotide-binding enzyme